MRQAPSLSLLEAWALEPGRLRHDVPLCGSPERCLARWAVEDATGRVWVLERIASEQWEGRERIGRVLAFLSREFTQLAPYRMTWRGAHVALEGGEGWQLSPYLGNDPLPRPEYLRSAPRGDALGRCMVEFARASESLPDELAGETPARELDLEEYVRALLEKVANREPEVARRARGVEKRLQGLWNILPELPRAFCHGDCHPLNVLWQGEGVLALIDWEFCASRFRQYDLANCLGCVGIEDPRALGGEFAIALLDRLRDSLLDGAERRFLPDMVLALRFAWLSEWLRHGDRDMIGLELDYMELLCRNRDRLAELWRTG